jgi:EmrB/QacA subfamily drug resistance transporter
LSTDRRWRLAEPPAADSLKRLPYYDWLIVGVCCVSAFLGQLDATIVQLALPALTETFAAPVHDIRWVAIAYLLAYAAVLPVFSQVSEILGRKVLYLLGFAIFATGSALCGLAPDLPWLIAFRILQGMGGGLLGANSIAILVSSIDQSRRPHAIGLLTTAQAIGVSAGPAAGGVLLETLGWSWVFWFAVPFALAAMTLGWFVLPLTRKRASDTRFDGLGALLLAPSLVLAILVLNQIAVWPVTSAPTLLCIGGTIVLFALFIWRERRAPSPLIDLKLFGHGAFVAGMLGIVLAYALLYGMFFLMSFALMHGFHNSALLAGFKLAIIPAAIGLIAPLGTAIGKKRGARHTCVAGMALSAGALLALTAIALHPIGSLVTGLTAFAVFGMGLGFFIAPNNNATLDAAPPDRAGQAAALLNLLRVFGSCIGVSAASSMMLWRVHERDVLFGGRPLIDAVEASLALLVVFAVLAGVAALVQSPKARPS